MTAEGRYRAAAGLALAVGGGAALAPGTLIRAYGVSEPLTGPGAFGWRLFASRNLVVGTAAWHGNAAARGAIVPIQLVDQLAFAHAGLSGVIPRRTWAAAALTSAASIYLCQTARPRPARVGDRVGRGG